MFYTGRGIIKNEFAGTKTDEKWSWKEKKNENGNCSDYKPKLHIKLLKWLKDDKK